MITEFERTGPGQEKPGIQTLLRLGPGCLPAVAEAFPGLLWFNRWHPHSAVARGRDVSPIARCFLAFGEASIPYIEEAMRSPHPDVRYYALLVALELPPEDLIEPIALAAIDGDMGVRGVAAAAEPGFDTKRTRRCCRIWKTVLERGVEMRPHVIFAVHAVARARDPGSVRHLIALLGTVDDEVDDVTTQGLIVLTGQDHGLDPELWTRWFDDNEERHRIDWLIDSLAECRASVYPFVAQELIDTSKQDFGRADVDEAGKRMELADDYRRWWSSARPR